MQENEECVICHQFNDQMLMLQCVHDPCINCAAVHYAEEFKGKLKNYYYTCQLCGERTALDISSVIELEKLAPKRHDEPPSIKKPLLRELESDSTTSLKRKIEMERNNYREDVRDVSTLRDNTRDNQRDLQRDPSREAYDQPSFKDLRGSINKRVKMCKDHPEEEVSYYCFKCLENICPECAIHGAHQGHDVKAVKKAVLDVRKQFSGIIDNIAKAQLDLRKNKEHYNKKIKDLSDETTKQKNFVAKEFESLRNYLMSKERECLREIDEVNHRNVSILTTEIDLINRQTDDTHKLTRSIEQTLKKEDISILEEFGRKSQSYSNEVEKMSVSQVGYTPVPGLKAVNLSDLKQIMSGVNNSLSEFGIKTEDLVYS